MYNPNFMNDSFYNDFFEDLFGDFFGGSAYRPQKSIGCKKLAAPSDLGRMATDVREYEKNYELDVELPGFDKSEIQVELKDGYLSVSAEHASEVKSDSSKDAANTDAVKTEEQADAKAEVAEKKDGEVEKTNGKYIRRERFYGKVQRSFYVGKNVLAEDIKAEFKNGILKLNVPKDDSYDKVEKKDFISIAD